MRFGSLFSGIGGLDLGLEMAGMECTWMVEVEKFGSKILRHHWPKAKIYGDIHEINGKELEPVDLICGGFPCQPVSFAGKRGGTSDERWLWGEFARIIRQVKPRWVVAENVTGLLSANSGRAFAEVLRDLAEGGYDAVWNVFPAGGQGGVGAPHRRERIFIIGRLTDSESKRPRRTSSSESSITDGNGKLDNNKKEVQSELRSFTSRRSKQDEGKMADTDSTQRKGSRLSSRVQTEYSNINCGSSQKNVANTKRIGQSRQGESVKSVNSKKKEDGETVEFVNGSFQNQWSIEPDVGRVAHGVPNRVDRLKALGNAVVPQVARQIGEMIMEIESV